MRPRGAAPPASILVLKPSSFGDIIHTLPAAARLERAWPEARITWLVNPEWEPLLDGNPDLAGTFRFPRREFRGWGGWRRFRRWERETLAPLQPDLAVDFQGLLRSAWMGWRSGAKVLHGSADAREGARWLYHRTAPVPGGVPHAVERYLALADAVIRAAGGDAERASAAPLSFPLPAGQPVGGIRGNPLPEGFTLLHPFARGQGKSLLPAQVRELCRLLAPRPVVLVGGSAVNPAEGCPNAVNLLGQTALLQLVWLLRRAAFVVSVDSGPAHLAAALGRPMAAIHTWSDPRRVGPYRPDAWIWKGGRLFRRREMPGISEEVFRARPPALTSADLRAIAALAISAGGSSA